MALNISSSQIYAGRYHYKRPEIPNLLDTQKYTASTPGKSVKEATGVDTVTISDEGLAKAKDWREYTKDNENISHTGVNPKEELYKELNTVNNIDTASMFNCELGEVADQIQKENGLGDHSRSQEEFLTVMAKAYQVIYDRIDEEFSDPDGADLDQTGGRNTCGGNKTGSYRRFKQGVQLQSGICGCIGKSYGRDRRDLSWWKLRGRFYR